MPPRQAGPRGHGSLSPTLGPTCPGGHGPRRPCWFLGRSKLKLLLTSGGQNAAGRGGRLLVERSRRPFSGQLCPEAVECQGIRGSLLVKWGLGPTRVSSVSLSGKWGGSFGPGHCLRTNRMRNTSRVCGTDYGVAVVGVRTASSSCLP